MFMISTTNCLNYQHVGPTVEFHALETAPEDLELVILTIQSKRMKWIVKINGPIFGRLFIHNLPVSLHGPHLHPTWLSPTCIRTQPTTLAKGNHFELESPN